ncbi:helix-turn-helix domain-containing protein [Amycolatopsis granulosa]|uniref:winged helix-turn-helix transcriptional regulator n=1 Tax=Amycolatopsis granulosa TaxID=185684 RepID=UPI00312C7246|nr:DNA-binding HxlR family transcriptional regulator [Amycolatopsis granulosa]
MTNPAGASHDAPALPGRPCSIAAALHLVGDKWALLAIRELTLGNHRFIEIARDTGAPRDRLAARLRGLEAAGVVERQQYSEHPPRFEYHLTEAGRDLGMVLQALRSWGDRWAVDEPPVVFEHTCGHPLDAALMCRHCGAEVVPGDVHAHSGAGTDEH